MLINPLKTEENCGENNHKFESNKDVVISEMLSFLITNYADYLSDISINKKVVENIVRERVYKEYSNMNTESTIEAILDRLFGYHILQKYIDDEKITDIRVTQYNHIFIKKLGVWEKTKDAFSNENDYLNFVRYCILKNGGKITTEIPIVTVSDRKNHLRIEAGIEPVNVNSPNLVIRIHRPNGINKLEELANKDVEMINEEICEFLSKAMIASSQVLTTSAF